MLFRAAYGMTLSRPQVRELAPYDYYDFLRDRKIIGNPALKTATIHNADVRWEWFFGEGQVAAVSGFYKRFIDPIELQIINTPPTRTPSTGTRRGPRASAPSSSCAASSRSFPRRCAGSASAATSR